jgi:hypothetical protein
VAASKVGARKSERGRAVGKGRGVSSSSEVSEAAEEVEGEEGRMNVRWLELIGRFGVGAERFDVGGDDIIVIVCRFAAASEPI